MRRFLKKTGPFYDAYSAFIWGALAFLLTALILFAGKNIGLSDNGDFKRVMDASSLVFTGDEAAYAYNGRYRIVLGQSGAAGNVLRILFGGERFDKYPSLQVPLTRISVVLNLVVNKLSGTEMTVYRLEILGLLNALLYAAAIGFLAASFRLQRRALDILAKAILLIILCDVGYVTYFNSFYGESLQMAVFVFLAALFIRIVTGKPGAKEAVLSALGCVALGWGKFFNIPAACVLMVLLEGLILLKKKRKAAVISGVAAIAVLSAVWLCIPSWMGVQTKINAVFFGALRGADRSTAEKYLDALGLPQELAKFRDKHAYVEGVALEMEELGYDAAVGSVSNIRLGLLYLKHPELLARALEISRLNAGSIRPVYLGNCDPSVPKLTLSHRFSVWSDVRSFLGFDTWPGIAGVTLAFFVVLYMALRRAGLKLPHRLFVLLLLAGVYFYFFAGPYVSNGECDLAKHLFAFAQMTDLMVLFVVISGISALDKKEKRRAAPQVLSAMMTLALLFLPVKAQIAAVTYINRTHGSLEAGAHVKFGSYRGNKLVWTVLDTDGAVTLLCSEALTEAAFSEGNGNDWEFSTLRSWLNGEFLRGFSAEERRRIEPIRHAVLLSREDKNAATSGDGEFYFSHVPVLASRGHASAYQKLLDDGVTLPDTGLVTDLTLRGAPIALRNPYWLDTPYYNNGYMVRCVMPDGTVLMREARVASGVRPVIRVKASGILSGDGSSKNPFILS
jgi:hypothetical protein